MWQLETVGNFVTNTLAYNYNITKKFYLQVGLDPYTMWVNAMLTNCSWILDHNVTNTNLLNNIY